MRLTLTLFVLAFILLPPDAQFWLVGLLRGVWLSPSGQAFAAGALGATATAMIWYAAGWNALARHLHRDDYARADDALRKRRRG
jgi:membrane protein DedA with SNARE-associated domain